MSLTPGALLGPYRIDAPLGAGGMGEVYRATDPRVPRIVAIKVLPATVDDDPSRRARFDREARAIGSLKHPNICPLFDVGEHAGHRFLVMELVEGETLSKRIERGPLPLGDALRYAIEIAAALDHAHRQGIVHRDLKPANVMITKAATRLLDFGLAKFKPGPVSHGSASATRSADATIEGEILGTLQYMPPEQLEGRDADARSDIFAFGAVLYEMITGRKAFEGKTRASLIGAILRDEPLSMSMTQRVVPPALERVVRTCLQKDPDERWQSAGDLARELRWVAGDSDGKALSGGTQAGVDLPAARYPHRLVLIGTVASLMAGAAIGIAWSRSRAVGAPGSGLVRHSELSLMPAEALLSSNLDDIRFGGRRPSSTAIALSRNGHYLAFAAEVAGVQRIFLRDLESSKEATPLQGTEGGEGPFFSPDGLWIGFWTAGALRKVPITGGQVLKICDTPRVLGAAWGDNTIVFGASGDERGLRRAAASGTSTRLTTPNTETGETLHDLPFILPDNRAVLFTVRFGWDGISNSRVVVQKFDGGPPEVLEENAADGRYVPTGHLVFVRAGTLMAAPFDLKSLRVTGTPVEIVADVMQALNNIRLQLNTAAGQYAFSDRGDLVYATGSVVADAVKQLVWIDRSNHREFLSAPPLPYTHARLLPHGEGVIAAVRGKNPALVVWRLPGGSLKHLYDGFVASPVVAAEGRAVIFSGRTTSVDNLFTIPTDGSANGRPSRLTTDPRTQRPSSMSPDGNDLIYLEQSHPGGAFDIWLRSMQGQGTRALIRSQDGFAYPAVSPDGHWLAFTTGGEVVVEPYPSLGHPIRVSTDGGDEPQWTGKGEELLYRHIVGVDRCQLMSVKISDLHTFAHAVPTALFETSMDAFPFSAPISAFDVTPDGSRIIGPVIESPTPPPPKHLQLIVNWFDELLAKVPRGK